ncbi:MAG: hypothetical protein LBD13_06815 [Spirochaetaceae bacterium]|nr:hypothetical protein [Spirochaetaceae bacterium]
MKILKTLASCGGIAALALLLTVSCSARVNGTLHQEGSGSIFLRAALEPRMAALIRSLSRLNNPSAPPKETILDGRAIGASISAAPGVTSASLGNTNPVTIEGPIEIGRMDSFLALPGNQGASRFITYQKAGSGGRFTLRLNRDISPKVMALLSPDAADYLSALMAPAATGEALSKTEYLSLVRSVYGRDIAEEIAGARVRATVDFPGPISAIRGGTVSGASKNRAEFDIPLLDLLVLETELEYEALWN